MLILPALQPSVRCSLLAWACSSRWRRLFIPRRPHADKAHRPGFKECNIAAVLTGHLQHGRRTPALQNLPPCEIDRQSRNNLAARPNRTATERAGQSAREMIVHPGVELIELLLRKRHSRYRSMRSIRVLYTVAVLSLAGLFLVPDPFLHGIAAVLLIVGALPMFRVIARAVASQTLINARKQLTLPEDAPHTQEDDRSSEDRIASHQSAR